jgi:outer membrane immunogenic protein
MKGLIYSLLFLLLLLSSSLSAQTGVRFGLRGGYSLATQYGISPAEEKYIVDTKSRHGFVGGVFAYFPVTESVGIQQELLYAMKGSRQDVTITDPVSINTVSEYDLNYFEMPILLRYTFVKIKNVGFYGSTGIALSLLMNGKYTIASTVNVGGPPIKSEESGSMKGLDTFDYSFCYGAGANFKLLNKDFFLEYRMTVGWNTLAMPNVKGAATVPLRNQDYILTLGFYL